MASPLAKTGTYAYEPLHTTKHRIRVLHLLPGTLTSDIRIKLRTVDFDEEEDAPHVRYEALSYTWGDPANPASIEVLDQGFLEVTRSCEDALRCLRHAKEERILWIDAICINQQDFLEKGRQVARMSSVYSRAQGVIAFLGSAADESDFAMQTMRNIVTRVDYDHDKEKLVSLTADLREADPMVEMSLSSAELEAIIKLLSRPWFERLWIVQEIRLGMKRATLKCGLKEMPWAHFSVAFRYLAFKTPPSMEVYQQLKPRVQILLFLDAGGQAHLTRELNDLRQCKCTDQRDRIYAGTIARAQHRLGIDAWGLQPDYNKSVKEVFTHAALALMHKTRTLDFLGYVADENVVSGLPSWVPDWSAGAPRTTLDRGWASHRAIPSAKLIGERELHVKGISVSKVKFISPSGVAYDRSYSLQERYQALRNCVHALLEAKYRDDPKETSVEELKPQLEIICRILETDGFSDSYEPHLSGPLDFQTRKTALEYLVGVENFSGTRDQLTDLAQLHMSSLVSELIGRSLLLLEDGSFGMGPAGTQVGDVVSVILGCDTAVVLRPTTTSEQQQFQVIGGAYCHGTMCGEALLGPIPDHLQHIRVLAGRAGKHSNYVHGFRDLKTGAVMTEDPRLPTALPHPWKEIGPIPGSKDWNMPHIFNTETKETRPAHWDPRCEANALERRGVELVTFVLV